MKFKDLLTGFIRLHVLHQAAEHEIYGQWMIEELAGHDYKLSPGTLYPLLHGMEQKGDLRSRRERWGGRRARSIARRRSAREASPSRNRACSNHGRGDEGESVVWLSDFLYRKTMSMFSDDAFRVAIS